MPQDKKNLKVIVCTEGGTLNGFAVTREQIQQMADNYDPRLYAARINLEHITSIFPDSQWRHFSMIDSAKAVELDDGPLKGKLALEVTASIDPVKDAELIRLNESGQKIFSSIEFLTQCPNERAEGAYLTGVAFTDTPAAFGTEVIKLSNQERGLPVDAKNTYTASLETELTILSLDSELQNESRSFGERFLSGLKKTLGLYREEQSSHIKALSEGIELTASKCAELMDQVGKLTTVEEKQKESLAAIQQELTSLKEQLNQTEKPSLSRPLATGGEDIQSDY